MALSSPATKALVALLLSLGVAVVSHNKASGQISLSTGFLTSLVQFPVESFSLKGSKRVLQVFSREFDGDSSGSQSTGSFSSGNADAVHGMSSAEGGGGVSGFNDGTTFIQEGNEGDEAGSVASFSSIIGGGGVATAEVANVVNIEDTSGSASFTAQQGSSGQFDNSFSAELTPAFLTEEELEALNETEYSGPLQEFNGEADASQENSAFTNNDATAACGPAGRTRNLQGAPCSANAATDGFADAFMDNEASSGADGSTVGGDAFAFISSGAGAGVNASSESVGFALVVLEPEAAGQAAATGFGSGDAFSESSAESSNQVVATPSYFGN